jgi:transcriptional regulator with XRE-family HTH domain
MNESAFNNSFAQNLKFYLKQANMTQADLAEYMNVSTASISNWCTGNKIPRMDKVDKLCELFDINRSDLIEDKDTEHKQSYYLNPETSRIAQKIYDNKELSVLFDAAQDAEPEDLQALHGMLMALKRKEKGN